MLVGKEPVSEIAIDESQLTDVEKEITGKMIFLVAGRLIYRKGHKFLLDALNKVPSALEYEVRIVGMGKERESLERIISNNENLTKHVTLVGSVPYLEMEKEYQRANVLIMPSIRETTGTVLLEAMAKGIPVITINKFGGPVLFDNETAFLYEGKSRDSYIDALCEQIVKCINSPSEVIRRGYNARKKAEKFTWKEKNSYYQDIYNSLLVKG